MLEINYRDSRPIYEQIKDGLRKLLVSGAISRDQKLPSVRELASSMSINPNTIQRAYRELESEGYIYSVPGKGSFASGTKEIDEKLKAEMKRKITDIAAELKAMLVDRETVKGWIDEAYND